MTIEIHFKDKTQIDDAVYQIIAKKALLIIIDEITKERDVIANGADVSATYQP